MIEIMPHSTDNMLSVIVTGRIEQEDDERSEPEMERRAQCEGPFDVLVEAAEAEGLEPPSAMTSSHPRLRREDRPHGGGHHRRPWRRVTGRVGKPIALVFDIDTERFNERVEAQGWLARKA